MHDKNPSWGQRHGATVLTVSLFGLMALIMFIQVGC
jgi:hypothetical protein